MNDRAKQLTAGRLLARNTVWSLLGTGLPFLVAAVAIPLLIKGLGTERFGLLAIIWVVIGYFSVFDLGLGRALTQLVAERLGDGREQDVPNLAKTALGLVALLGIVAAATIASVAPWLVGSLLKVPWELRVDGVRALWVLSLSLPFVIISGALVGLLQAHQKFRAISSVRIVTGSLTFLGPLIALHWTRSLTAAAGALAVSRILASVAYGLLCCNAFPTIWREGRFQATLLRPLVRFGSWFTVDNIVAPLIVYMDRFLIGSLLGLAAIAYYETPYEVVTRLGMLPAAAVSVLFPAFTTALAADQARVAALFGRSCRVLIILMMPPAALIILFAPEGLSAWVGPALAQHSTTVLRWLAVGVLMNSMARLPHALIQGAGRPDIVAKLHLVELPIFLIVLWLLMRAFSIEGAAVAWALRVGADTAALFWLGGRLVPAARAASARSVGLIATVCAGIGFLALVPNLDLKMGLTAILLTGALILAYREARNLGWTFHASATKV